MDAQGTNLPADLIIAKAHFSGATEQSTFGHCTHRRAKCRGYRGLLKQTQSTTTRHLLWVLGGLITDYMVCINLRLAGRVIHHSLIPTLSTVAGLNQHVQSMNPLTRALLALQQLQPYHSSILGSHVSSKKSTLGCHVSSTPFKIQLTPLLNAFNSR